jgi:integrase
MKPATKKANILEHPDQESDELRSMGLSLCAVLDNRRKREDDTYPIKLRIIYQRKPLMIGLGVSTTEEEWVSVTKTSTRGRPKTVQKICLDELKKAENILLQMDGFNPQEFKTLFKGKSTDQADIWGAFDVQVESLTQQGRVGYADTFRGSKQSFYQFMNDKRKHIATFDQITVDWLESYVKWGNEIITRKDKKKKRLSNSSIGIHIRNLRVLHNIALLNGGAKKYPFSRYKEPKAENNKRALSRSEIEAIMQYSTDNSFRVKYKDLFVFSYQACGMNLADVLRLRWGDISTYPSQEGTRKERILFQRKKTSGKQIETKRSVLISKEMRRIIDEWGNPRITDNTYVFPTLSGSTDEEEIFRRIKQETRALNKHLKEICKELQIDGAEGVTSYAARHSYVTHAIHSGHNVTFVQDRLGHADPRTTMSYIKSIDPELLEQSTDFVVGFE